MISRIWRGVHALSQRVRPLLLSMLRGMFGSENSCWGRWQSEEAWGPSTRRRRAGRDFCFAQDDRKPRRASHDCPSALLRAGSERRGCFAKRSIHGVEVSHAHGRLQEPCQGFSSRFVGVTVRTPCSIPAAAFRTGVLRLAGIARSATSASLRMTAHCFFITCPANSIGAPSFSAKSAHRGFLTQSERFSSP
jgi:hypothetical protein